jgi:hypothetical protein
MANEFKIKNGLVVSGSADIEQDLTVRGKIIADQLNISIVSSSVLYESGSTKFGDSIDDNHAFTGSVNITGSINLNGQAIGTGKLDETTFNTFTSSYKTVSGSINTRLGSLESFSSSINSNFVSEAEFGTYTGSLNSFTSSTLMTIGALNSESSSIRSNFNSFTSSYTNVSSSLDTRLDTLETLSGSFTGSFRGDGTNLFNIPASGVTGLNLTQIADGSVTASVSNTNGLRVNSKTEITGSLIVTNGITGSIDYINITNKPTLVSGSSQIDITSTTGYSTFSSSVSSSLGSLSSSIATTDGNQNTRLGLIETSTGSLNTFTSSASGRLTSLETSTGSLNSFTASVLTRVSAIETSTGSLNTFTASALTRVSAIETSTGSLNTFTSSASGRLTSLESASSSIRSNFNTFTSSASGRLTSLETTSGSINTFTASALTRVSAIETSTGSLNTFTSSASGRLTSLESASSSIRSDFNSFTSSNNSVESTQNSRLTSIESTTGSLNTFTSSASGRLTSLETSSGSINTFTASALTRVSAIETSTGSLNTFTSSIATTIKNKLNTENVISGSIQVDITSTTGYSTFSSSISSSIGSLSSSIATTDSNQNTRLGNLETSTGSLNTFTSSALTRVSAIETATSSLNSFTSSINTTIKTKLNSDGVISGSSQISLSQTNGYSTFSSSIASTDFVQDGRLTSIESKTGSYATTGSNVFKGDQTISGSVTITENLRVFGSSSITYVTSSQLRVEDNIITVNTASPGSRFGGLEVHDSGSVGIATGSLLWDSINNRWIYQNSSEATYGGGVLLSGPRSSGSLGSELTLTSGKIARSAGGDHLNDSIITEYGGTAIGVSGSLDVTGSINVGGGGKLTVATVGGDEGGEILLGKAATNTTLAGDGVTIDVWQNRLRIFEQGGNARGAYLDISTLANGVGTNLLGTAATASYVEYSNVANKPTLVSGSSQISYTGITNVPSGIVSGSSQVLLSSGVWSGSAQLPSGIISGSSQLPSGTVSGSSQISFNGITDKPTLVSGSSQVLNGSGVWSGSAQLPSGVVSGSGQITYSGISGIPSGIVSGSSQIAFGSITGVPSGLVSGSSQVLSGTGIWSGSAQLPAGVVSGSSQIAFGSITGVPSGLVSGSSQVLAGTTIHSGAFFNGITVVSGSGQISFGGITGVPSGLVSGSSQIAYGSITGVPSGLVSGSSQITYGSLTGIPSGIVSGSSQIAFGSITGIPSGLVSGSSQIAFGSITGVPSGLVSGSSQISLTSTTGFGTYLNQAVLTTSTPTFSTVSATTFTGALSGNATTANSAGVLTASGGLTTQYGNGTVGYSYALVNPQTGLFAAVDNSNSILTVNRHPDNYYSQLGFSSNGNLYYRSFSATAINTSQAWQTIWTSNSLTNLNQLTNGPGYITGITLSNVTTALGYTPYNSTNPNGYITGITFANVSSKPTTISGYGITDAITTANIGSQSVSSATSATFATNSSKLYSTDSAYSYTSGAPYYGFLTYDGTYWQFKVSPASPANVRVYTADTLGGYSYSNSSGANTIVQRDANGYIQNNYFNASGGGSERNASGMGYFAGHNTSDYYYRSYTAAAAAALLSGQSMNISGTATNITAYTINQSVGTSNAPTFAGLTVGAGVATGRSSWGSFTNANIILSSSTSDSTGNCGIEFRSGNNYPSDGAAIYFENNASGGASERAKLTIRVENDLEDAIEIRGGNITLNANTISAGGQNPSIVFQNAGTTVSSISSTGVYNGSISGNAATAGSLTSMNISQFTNNSGYITGVTNISGTAASETLSTVTSRGNSTAQNIVFSNGRKGLVGVYDAAQTQAIFAMGASYVLTDGGGSGTLGNHYGLAWSYNPDYGGAGNNPQSKAGLNHQLLHMQAGITTTAIGTGIWTSGGITCGTILPLSNNAHNLGSTGTRWANIYTNDLHLSNEGKPGGNEIDGTTGDWTIQEGEENLYIINHKNGKKFKIDLTEIV